MVQAEKVELVRGLSEQLTQAQSIVLTDFKGINGAADSIQIHVVHRKPSLVFINQHKGGAIDLSFGNTQSSTDASGQQRLTTA